MKPISDLSTRTKLFLCFGLIILFQAAVIIIAIFGITALRESYERLYEEDFEIAVMLMDIRSNQNAILSDMRGMLLTTDAVALEQLRQDTEDRNRENQESLNFLLHHFRDDPVLLPKLEAFAAVRDEFVATRVEQVLPLIEAGKLEVAKAIILGFQTQRNQEMQSIADELVAEAQARAENTLQQVQQQARDTGGVFLLLGLLSLASGIGLALLLDRMIANPLKNIACVAERIASGDLTVEVISNHRRDEVGALAQGFHRMVESLRTVNREIQEGISILASSASDILASTTQVASGAAQTATAVGETTMTVEEVKQTAQVTLQKAKYVSDNAQKSAQVSQTGKKAVEESIQGMRLIQEQMEFITESILRLSEQSQAIGEINATVNDLAEQSNLLAVNAAIEAAKAGEYGKGFGVVAQEVRSLAEQSKQATAQVRAILTEIQKATHAAVMATEQGSRAVETWTKQSAEVREVIRQLADSITESAQAAMQIAVSSQQQTVGMDQVAQAMENIKMASTQNVAGARQAEIAAQHLHDLGLTLKQLVERYKV